MAPKILTLFAVRPRVKLAFVATLTAVLLNASENVRTRNFHFEYKVTLKPSRSETGRLEVWVPVPHDDAYQQISDLAVSCPYQCTMALAPDDNKILHLVANLPHRPTVVKLTFNATRCEHRQYRLYGGPHLDRDEDPGELSRWLRPDRLVPIDDQIRTWARQVVQAADAHTDLEMARAIYNHVVATVKYDKTGKGWGRGDIYYACEARRGNCTDFHAIFIGYARALGIPARFSIGFPLPANRGEGKIAGYHCWAEFYAKGVGWVPIDASEASKDPSRREYFFGALDENRIEFTTGRDVVLAPRQKGPPLNYFVYPYAEVNGKPFDGIEQEITYRDIGASDLSNLGVPR